MHVTLADVAREAGVSTMTVSRTLRDLPNVKASTRDRVLKAAEALQYRPDPALQALSQRRLVRRKIAPTRTGLRLALLTARANPIQSVEHLYQRMLYGAQRQAEELGYTAERVEVSPLPKEQARMQGILIARGIQGLILGPCHPPYNVHLDWNHFSAVQLNHGPRGTNLHAVRNDLFQQAVLALAKLAEAGAKRIAVLNSDEGNRPSEFRAMGAASVAAELFGNAFPEVRTMHHADPEIIPRLRAYQPDGVACISGPGSWPTLRKAGLLPGKTVRFIMLNKPNDDAYCAGVGVLPERLGEEAVFLLHAMLLRGEHGVPNQRKIVRLESTYSHGNSMELA